MLDVRLSLLKEDDDVGDVNKDLFPSEDRKMTSSLGWKGDDEFRRP